MSEVSEHKESRSVMGRMRRTRVWRRLLTVATAAATLTGFAAASTPAAADTSNLYIVWTPSIVGSLSAANDVASVGGTVLANLDVADGVEAQLSSLQVTSLQAMAGVVVTSDFSASVADTTSGPNNRPGAAVFPQQTGATQLWANGDNGAGVNVAVLDTGIDSLPDFAGRMVDGVDLSGGNNPWQDGYGHGTFVAGLIAGNGASSNGAYTGEAPGAGLVSVKVAGNNGSTDVATVLKGLQWVSSHQQTDAISVINLSLGAQPQSSTVQNPLDHAVEKLWHAGVVVVTSAGNAGPFNGTILSPGDDPLVITVGAMDDQGQTSPSNDLMVPWSSVGPTNPDGWFKPDLVASGRTVVSLRAPGSYIDTTYPSAEVGTGNFLGSGTSFSAAVTSGAVALVLQHSPGLNPDTVKGRLIGTTTPGPVGNPFVDGFGDLNALGAAQATFTFTQHAPSAATPMGATVSLESTWSGTGWNGTGWNGTGWNGQAYQGTGWNGTGWNGTGWNGAYFNGTGWNGTGWNSGFWSGTGWNGTGWNGSAWDGTGWNGTGWNGASWTGTGWNGSAWN
ncbi:MAG TPA: S8 family serine peptidase [Acidimicrobiales bacterium]|nr:S8 family serine peptidase [Acidimicrobiales bacterium]